MRSILKFSAALLLGLSALVSAQKDERQRWDFKDAKIVVGKKGEPTPSFTADFDALNPIPKPVIITNGDVLKIHATFIAGNQTGVPHQAYVFMKQFETDIETAFPMEIQATTAKGKVEISQKDFPPSFIVSDNNLLLSLAVGDFTVDLRSILVPITILQLEYDAPTVANAKHSLGEIVRYEKKPEIHHIFRAEPKNPPKIITLVFLSTVIASLVGLFAAWAALGANLNALPKALSAAPVAHPLFFGSLCALEGIFMMYYLGWNLFKTLAAVGVVAPVALFSGSRALREVRARRLAGEL